MLRCTTTTTAILVGFAAFLSTPFAPAFAEDPSPVGKWTSTGNDAFVLHFKSDGTGTHFLLDLRTGKLSDPLKVQWRVDKDSKDPQVFPLDDARLDRKGCRMHLNPNGNLSIRGNTEGKLWVLVPESSSK